MKYFFLLLSLVIPNLTHAQSWEYVASTKSGERYFIDPETIKRIGPEIKFTQLSNHPDGFKYDLNIVYSIVTHRTANCELNKYKSGYLFAYPELYAQGGIKVSDFKHDTKWIDVKDGTMASFMQENVCSRVILSSLPLAQQAK
jgi:hypothetical protein